MADPLITDDEVADFIAAGSRRLFLAFCARHLPWVAAVLDQTAALGVFRRVWDDAPRWPRAAGEARRRLASLVRAHQPADGALPACPYETAPLLDALDAYACEHPRIAADARRG